MTGTTLSVGERYSEYTPWGFNRCLLLCPPELYLGAVTVGVWKPTAAWAWYEVEGIELLRHDLDDWLRAYIDAAGIGTHQIHVQAKA